MKLPHRTLFLKAPEMSGSPHTNRPGFCLHGPEQSSCITQTTSRLSTLNLHLHISQSPFAVESYPCDGSRPMRYKQNAHSFKPRPSQSLLKGVSGMHLWESEDEQTKNGNHRLRSPLWPTRKMVGFARDSSCSSPVPHVTLQSVQRPNCQKYRNFSTSLSRPSFRTVYSYLIPGLVTWKRS